MKTEFICDSTLQISEDFRKNYPVHIIPLEVRLDDEIYEDNVNITAAEFYEAINNGKKTSTSQPAVGKILELYESLKAKGVERIVAFCVSSKLSGTFSSFKQAAELVNNLEIKIIDTTQIARIAGCAIEKIIKDFSNKTLNYEDIEKEYTSLSKKQNILVTVENMDFLYAGGRLSKAQFVLSNLLNILPVITINEGSLAVSEKHRGLSKTLNKICTTIQGKNPTKIIILYTNNDLLARAQEIVNKHFNNIDIEIHLVSPVIGAHAGPRAVAVGYLEY